ncbi:PREDICTED: uncharacterized protein LOC109159794 [Ipomoea nil]|uniref:uncharacterized protein LOC109159794 n=1 Tax=Ipomoea nil TaxID=35883 RepID=UPI0009008E2B|nr:PREDICTED: uncharacterized protein LOC109159794 [Ipomoea nil]
MTDCKPLATPASVTQLVSHSTDPFDNPTQYRRIAGALQYLTITRPDLSYIVNRLCQCMHTPTVISRARWTTAYGSPLRRPLTFMPIPTQTGPTAPLIGSPLVEVTWVVSLLRELGLSSSTALTLWCGNLRATYLCANPVFHASTKHVEVDYHFVRDKVSSGELRVNFVSTKEQLADIFIKPLSAACFGILRDKLNVVAHQPCA